VLVEKAPVLGICLGMQLFAKSSEEGDAEGLGWIDGEIKRFHFDYEREKNIRIPHVGWNTIQPQRESPLLTNVSPDQRFYFTHSYHIVANNPKNVIATTHYGYEFVSAIQHGNIFGVQFHPEKSHRRGIIIYKNFVEYT
jgi:glutamine amidotransferase